MSSDPDKLRRCVMAPASEPRLRCEGETTTYTTHIEDHWATMPSGMKFNWTHESAVQWRPDCSCPPGGHTLTGSCLANASFGRPDDAHLASGRAVGDMYLAMEREAPASERQVGGDHYRKHAIQPWDIIDEYGLSFYAGNALKYLLRDKGSRLEDLKKARHYIDKLIEIEEGKQ